MKIVTLVCFTFLMLSCALQTELPKGDWTIMFYLGDDNTGLNIIDLKYDVDELTKKSVITSNTRVFILYDGPTKGDSKLEILDSPFGINSRIIDLKKTSIPTTSDKELDMSDKNTLKQFIQYAKRKSPANNYALYFGSHGTGYTKTTQASLQIDQVKELSVIDINKTIEETGGLDLLVFDACLMGTAETIYEFQDSVDYIVASPEYTAGPGNDYTGIISKVFNTNTYTPYQLGIQTIENYYEHYNYLEENNITNTLIGDSNNTIYAEDLLQVYNVKKITNILKNIDYSSLPATANSGSGSTFDDFCTSQYINIFGIIESSPEYIADSNIITKPTEGLYKFISIYKPDLTSNYNNSYEETKFAINNPDWVNKIKP